MMSTPVTRYFLLILLCMFCTRPAAAGPFALHVDGGGVDRVNCPVTATLSVPDQLTADEVKTYTQGGAVLNPGTIYVHIEPVKKDGKLVAAKLHWVEPKLKAGEKKVYRLGPAPQTFAPIDEFSFKLAEGGLHRDLLFGAKHTGVKPINRHAFLKYDPNDHFHTYKHFHHAYGFDGETFITNGPGTGEPYKGVRYPHHRGMYIGWSKTRTDSGSYDTWHCSKGVALKFQKFIDDREFTGPVAAREVSLTDWTTGDGKPIVQEERTVTTWNVGKDARVMDFTFTLIAAGQKVMLDGDPQHAGFQFRAHNDVTKTHAKYIRPASAKDKGGDVWTDCAWVVNQFAVGDQKVAVAHFDHPENPGTKEGNTVYSTRNYGRFGAFAKHELEAEGSLTFQYRILVLDPAKHDVTQENTAKLYDAWVKPVTVKIGPG